VKFPFSDSSVNKQLTCNSPILRLQSMAPHTGQFLVLDTENVTPPLFQQPHQTRYYSTPLLLLKPAAHRCGCTIAMGSMSSRGIIGSTKLYFIRGHFLWENIFITFEKLCSTRGLMGASALFVQAHDAKNSEILQRCQTPVRENRLGFHCCRLHRGRMI